MPLISDYRRPATLEEAIALVAEPNHVVLAGGTTLNADRNPSNLVAVDLQALGIDTIVRTGGALQVGAMATIGDLADYPAVPAGLARIARAEHPSTMRTIATVGGCVASANAESVLLAALLAAGTTVELADDVELTLQTWLSTGAVGSTSIITGINVPADGTFAAASTGRTPADVPIVAAVAHKNAADQTTVAVTGVASTPVVVDPSDPTADLTPIGDFRGSGPYRLSLARTLTARALEAVA